MSVRARTEGGDEEDQVRVRTDSRFAEAIKKGALSSSLQVFKFGNLEDELQNKLQGARVVAEVQVRLVERRRTHINEVVDCGEANRLN